LTRARKEMGIKIRFAPVRSDTVPSDTSLVWLCGIAFYKSLLVVTEGSVTKIPRALVVLVTKHPASAGEGCCVREEKLLPTSGGRKPRALLSGVRLSGLATSWDFQLAAYLTGKKAHRRQEFAESPCCIVP